MVQIIVLYALLAGTFSLGKVLLMYTNPLMLVAIRMSIAGIILLLYQYFVNYKAFSIPIIHYHYFVQLCIMNTFIPYCLRYWALQYVPTAHACLWYNIGPFISYSLYLILRLERYNYYKLLGLLISIGGIFYTINPSPLPTFVVQQNTAHGALFISICCMSYGWIIIKKLLTLGYCPVIINGISMIGGGLLAFFCALNVQKPWLDYNHIFIFIVLIVLLIIVSNIICHTYYVYLLKKYSPTFLALTSFLSPLFASIYSHVLGYEQLNKNFFIGLVIITSGVMVFYFQEKKEYCIKFLTLFNRLKFKLLSSK